MPEMNNFALLFEKNELLSSSFIFEGRIYNYGSFLKSKLVPLRTQEDGHYRENPSNHELLTFRGVDCRG